jgi:hypothetical protein
VPGRTERRGRSTRRPSSQRRAPWRSQRCGRRGRDAHVRDGRAGSTATQLGAGTPSSRSRTRGLGGDHSVRVCHDRRPPSDRRSGGDAGGGVGSGEGVVHHAPEGTRHRPVGHRPLYLTGAVPDHDGDRTYAGLSEQRQSPPERLLVTALKQRLRRRSPPRCPAGHRAQLRTRCPPSGARPSALTHHLVEGASRLAQLGWHDQVKLMSKSCVTVARCRV